MASSINNSIDVSSKNLEHAMKEMIREIEVGRTLPAKAPAKVVQQVTSDFTKFNPFN
jgi:hypothetical protein